jgi:type I restriction enzyme R subunit
MLTGTKGNYEMGYGEPPVHSRCKRGQSDGRRGVAVLRRRNPARLARWKADEKRFIALRAHVKTRYADTVDWSDYEKRVRALLDAHVTAHEVITVVEPLAVFDDAAIEAARREEHRSDASIADEIAHRTLRAIEEKWDEDPVFFEKFSKLIKDTIDAFRDRRIEEKAYLDRIRTLRDRVDSREDEDDPTPPSIKGKGNETAFWGITRRELRRAGLERDDLAADIAVAVTSIIEAHRTVGWQHDRDVQNRMRNAIDDYFFDDVMRLGGPAIGPIVIDSIADDVLASARVRMADDGRTRLLRHSLGWRKPSFLADPLDTTETADNSSAGWSGPRLCPGRSDG